MARWTGGNEGFIHLRGKVSGWRGKVSCQEKKKKIPDGFKGIVIWDTIKKKVAERCFSFV